MAAQLDATSTEVPTLGTEIHETDCTIEHAGRTFEADGALVTDNRIVAYLASGEWGWPWRAPFTVTDWHGARIGLACVTGAWGGRGRARMHSLRVWLDDGREYNARGQGQGMIITGRRAAK